MKLLTCNYSIEKKIGLLRLLRFHVDDLSSDVSIIDSVEIEHHHMDLPALWD